jgi:hypothetical protein
LEKNSHENGEISVLEIKKVRTRLKLFLDQRTFRSRKKGQYRRDEREKRNNKNKQYRQK